MKLVAPVALLIGAALLSEAANAEQLRFITCPIYRDTDAGRKSGCWLADNLANGIRFDVSRSPTKPDWNYAVLVEGVAMQIKSNCGGQVLDPVRVSVLTDQPCTRHQLPAEGFAGNAFVLPKRNVRPLSVVRALPPRPFKNQTFSIPFDYRASFLVYQLSDYLFDQAASYALAVKPREVIVTGWAATDPTSVSGRVIVEDISIAKQRAEIIAESLRRLGVPKNIIHVQWKAHARPSSMDGADGLIEPSKRRVDIEVRI